jgi:glutathione S-transferase
MIMHFKLFWILFSESREICRYVAEKYEGQGYPFLLGKDALERASVEEWLHIEEHAFNPPSRALFCYLAFPADRYDNGDDTDMHIRKLEEVLDIYEQRLSNSEFLVGNKFTLADLVHLPNSHYIKASKKYLKLYDSRKNVRRWWDAISIRASWQHVLMDMKSVEEQNKQVELKEEHQQQKDHPRTPDYPLQMSSRIHTTRKPQTVLIDIPHEALISSSQSTPTDHRVSVAQSKEIPSQEKPPQKSPIHVQSTIAPATFPPTFEKPPIVGAARLSTKDDSSKDVQQHPSQDSEQEKVTRRPYTDQRRDVSSPLSQQTGGSAFGPDRLSHAEKKIAPSGNYFFCHLNGWVGTGDLLADFLLVT